MNQGQRIMETESGRGNLPRRASAANVFLKTSYSWRCLQDDSGKAMRRWVGKDGSRLRAQNAQRPEAAKN